MRANGTSRTSARRRELIGFALAGSICLGGVATVQAAAARTKPPPEDDPVAKFFLELISIPTLPLRLIESLENGTKGVREVASAGHHMAEVAQQMPEEIRVQVQQLQPQLEQATRISGHVERTATEFADAGAQWTQLIEAVHRLSEQWQLQRDASPPRDPAQPPAFSMADMARSTEGLARAAGEIRMLVQDVHNLVDSDAITGRVNDTATRAHRLTDHVAWRITELVLVCFCVNLLSRICRRLVGLPGKSV